MKLQFNLLPDVKQEYLKTQKTKRTVIAAACVAAAISFFILLFMFTNVYVINKKQLSDADKDVKKYSNQLKSIKDLDKILTIQNQLKSLSTLHQSKHVVSRLYTYLPQVTPANVYLGQISLDFTANTMNIQGTADSLKTINTFIDTLKFTTYKTGVQSNKTTAFSSVIETAFGVSSEAGAKNNQKASYQLTVQFDPVLFSNMQNVELVVPQGLSTTRSVLNDPGTLFTGETGPTTTKKAGEN